MRCVSGIISYVQQLDDLAYSIFVLGTDHFNWDVDWTRSFAMAKHNALKVLSGGLPLLYTALAVV